MTIAVTMSPPASPPASSCRSSSAAVGTPATRHKSRRSFAVPYSGLALSSTPQTSNIDPKSPTGALIIAQRRPPASLPVMSAASSSNAHHSSKPFVAPAHPQSHHLHSLPPREKTTRTLILDHTAWKHGRTRLAQGRCELGMKYKLKPKEYDSDTRDVAGNMPGFMIGSSNSSGSGTAAFRRFCDFGEPPEADVASSDEEGEDNTGFWDSDQEGIRAMSYGKGRRRHRSRRKFRASRMDVDSEGHTSQDDSDRNREDDEIGSEEESVALSLSSRAVGMEKVLHAMLAQPPSSPPRSPSPPPYGMQNSQPGSHHQSYFSQPSTSASSATSRILPNGLRLRLALLTVVNDLFERQTSASVEASPSPSAPMASSRMLDTKAPLSSTSFPSLPPPSLTTFPAGLTMFLQISSQPHYTPPTLPSFHTLSLPASSASPPQGFSARSTPSNVIGVPYGALVDGPSNGKPQVVDQSQRPPPPLFSWKLGSASNSTHVPAPAMSRSKPAAYHTPWSSPSTQRPSSSERASGSVSNMPSSWRDARHHLPNTVKPSVVLTKRAAGRAKEIYAAGCFETPVITNTYKSNVQTFSYRAAPPRLSASYPVHRLKKLCPRHLLLRCKICDPPLEARGSRSPTRIGAGLLRKEGLWLDYGNCEAPQLSGSVLIDLLPRFLRLSALVAMELGREARGEEPEANDGQGDAQAKSCPSIPSTSGGSTPKTSPNALPTRAWYALLCGLITRGVLEGYVARGWKGSEYVEVLMGIGMGIKGIGTRPDAAGFGNGNSPTSEIPTVEECKNEFEPDEMLGLVDSCKVLFNGLVQDCGPLRDAKDKATREDEQEYVSEMEERMSEFLNVPHNCPDLATHLTNLSDKYPAKPIERAALGFCEAVAKWRGKPELEMYKKSYNRTSSKSRPSTPVALSIRTLLAGSPTPVPNRPPIHKYFYVNFAVPKPPPPPPPPPPRGVKRRLSVDDTSRDITAKKEKIDTTIMDIDMKADAEKGATSPSAIPDSEWVGPYGV